VAGKRGSTVHLEPPGYLTSLARHLYFDSLDDVLWELLVGLETGALVWTARPDGFSDFINRRRLEHATESQGDAAVRLLATQPTAIRDVSSVLLGDVPP